MLYTWVLSLHNILRWVVIILALAAAINALWGWFGKRAWTERDRKLGTYFSISVDTQLLVGLLLYFFLSPSGWARQLFSNFGGLMDSSAGRFFGLEHFFFMLLAVVFAHIGSSRSRKAAGDVNKFRTAAIWFGLAVIVILIGIPWPFLEYGRPWIRLPF